MTEPNISSLDIDSFGDAALHALYAYHELLREAGPVFWLESLGVYCMERFDAVTDLAERCRSIHAVEPVQRLKNTVHPLASLPVTVELT
jgi:hypothetical protein